MVLMQRSVDAALLRDPNVRALFASARSYIEGLLWIRDEGGRERPLILNKPQLAVRAAKAEAVKRGRPRRFLVPKFRKGGVTTQEQADSFALCANYKSQQAFTLADTAQKTEEIFQIAQFFWERIPPQLRPHRAHSNRRVLRFDRLGSEFFIGTAGSVSIAHGLTVQKIHGSEVPRWLPGRKREEFDDLMVGITEACPLGEITLEGTSYGNSGWWYDTIMESVTDGNEWTVIFLPWWLDDRLRAPVESAEEAQELLHPEDDRMIWLVEEIGLDAEQMKWRQVKLAESATMRRKFKEQYPEILEESFLASELAFFGADLLSELRTQVEPALYERDAVTVWEEPRDGEKYVVGADASLGNRESDWCVGAVFNRRTCRQAARFRSKVKPREFARQLSRLATRYNRALLAVEREYPGEAVLSHLDNDERYPNLYVSMRMTAKRKRTRELGWSTNSASRPIMLDDLREAMEDGHLQVNDLLFLSECSTFERDMKTGKYEAREGKHDDVLMAWAIAWGAHLEGGVHPGWAL